jgi:hypothetical protein
VVQRLLSMLNVIGQSHGSGRAGEKLAEVENNESGEWFHDKTGVNIEHSTSDIEC